MARAGSGTGGVWPSASSVARSSCKHSQMLHCMFVHQSKPTVEPLAHLQAVWCDAKVSLLHQLTMFASAYTWFLCVVALPADRQVAIQLKDTAINDFCAMNTTNLGLGCSDREHKAMALTGQPTHQQCHSSVHAMDRHHSSVSSGSIRYSAMTKS